MFKPNFINLPTISKLHVACNIAFKDFIVQIASSLTSLPKGISDRIMTLRLSLASKTHLTLISVYAPTMTHPDEEREAFYSCLREAIHSVPSKDKLLLLGDFNARVGRNKHAWPGVLGPVFWHRQITAGFSRP